VSVVINSIGEYKQRVPINRKPPFDKYETALGLVSDKADTLATGLRLPVSPAIRRSGTAEENGPSLSVISHVYAISGSSESRARLGHNARLSAGFTRRVLLDSFRGRRSSEVIVTPQSP